MTIQLPDRFGSILYIVQEKLGDGFLTLPFIYELHRNFPRVKISLIASKYNYKLFESLDFIEDLFIYRRDHSTLFRQLQDRQYDIFFSPKDHPSMTILRMMKHINATFKAGLQHRHHDKHFNILLPNDPNMHIVEKNSLLITYYGIKFPLKNKIDIIDQMEENFQNKWDKIVIKNNICINLSSGGLLRKLPTEKWTQIIDFIFQNNYSDKINLLAMPENAKDAKILKRKFPDKIQYPIPTENIYEAGVVIKNSSLLISPDTALVHVAAAVRTPIIGLYQNKGLNLNRFSPYQAKYEIVLSPDKELKNISVADITTALSKVANENLLRQ